MIRRLNILLILIIVIIGCKPKVSPFVVYTSVEGLGWQKECAKGDYNYQLKTMAESSNSAVRHVVISTFDATNLNKTITDTILQDPVKDLSMLTLYHTPTFEDTTLVQVTTTAYATDGETATYTFSLFVSPSEVPLTPLDNITLYAVLTGRQSYFSLVTMQSVMTAKSTELHFRDVAPKDSTDEISYSWTSPNIYFSRAENFDYAKATATTITNTYSGCTRDHTIQNLKANDVLLFGTADKAIGVIKIIYIADQSGNNNGYVFSMKVLSSKK